MVPVTRLTTAFVALTMVPVAPAAADNADRELGPGLGAGKVLYAQLGIKGPTTGMCPNEATATGWVFTDYPGDVTIMIARKGRGVGAPITLPTTPAGNGRHLATYSRKIAILGPIDAEYRLLVGGGSGVASDWVRLSVTCNFTAGGGTVSGGG